MAPIPPDPGEVTTCDLCWEEWVTPLKMENENGRMGSVKNGIGGPGVGGTPGKGFVRTENQQKKYFC
jgi:hypothetical protein